MVMVFSTWCRNLAGMGSLRGRGRRRDSSGFSCGEFLSNVWLVFLTCRWAYPCCQFRRHVLPWGSLGWKRIGVLCRGEDHCRSVCEHWSARGFPIIGTFVWGHLYQWSWCGTWFLSLGSIMEVAGGRGTSASTWV